jgi:flagellar hook-associated protein 1
MTLASALTIATGGLANITSQLAVVSQNVSNANTAGYTRELGQQTAAQADGVELGVRTGITQRSVDTALEAEAWQQTATVAALTVRSNALAAVDAAEGTPGGGTDLAGLTGALGDAFTTLSSSPAATADQTAVVTAATSLANGINGLAQAVGKQRQAAQDTVSQELTQLGTALENIGRLSTRIATLANQGTGTAALEDQRDSAMQTVAQLTGASFVHQSDGGVQVILPSGTTLPTDGSASPGLDDSQLGPTVAAPAVTLNGKDITAQLTGGAIGANLALRDTAMPTFQAELDEFSHDLALRCSAAGLDLFTDGTRPVAAASATPPVQAGYVGLANRIQVNPAIAANPVLVQSGTAGTTLGVADQTVIKAMLDQAFGPAGATTAAAPSVRGLGLSGALSAPFGAPAKLADFASDVVSAQSGAASDAATALTAAKATQQVLDGKVSAVSAVSVDAEMSTMIALQNAYGANARIISSVQQMWAQVVNMAGGA